MSKITLSATELELVNNAEWFLTKQSIISKVQLMFADVLELVRPMLAEKHHFKEIIDKSPKIFKGENYRDLPWVMLDYPREFSSENILAIRTMFWWANYFTVTLHLKGEYKEQLIASDHFDHAVLQKKNFFIASGNNEWDHHIERENYLPVKDLSKNAFEEIINQRSFLKIAKSVSLTEWDNAVFLIPAIYREMIDLF